ncbi:MAG: hypothetical protein KJ042_07110 [Deltaproteobacteria bacterium]|nr:hypothetical protein [Deltaproteobacteria bacterium]
MFRQVHRHALGLSLATCSIAWIAGRLAGMGAVDDAYITFRCARNLANGHGLVYNIGQNVEATSNFLYAIVIGLGMKLGAHPEFVGLCLNFAALGAMLYVLAVDAGVTDRETLWDARRMSGIVWAISAQPATWVYAHSGMETIAFTALLFGGFLTVARSMEKGTGGAWAGLWIALAATIRMEAAAFMAPACAFLFLYSDRGSRARRVIATALLFAAIFVPVTAYRYSFYGDLFPNTYYAKVDGGSLALAERGVIYVAQWFGTTLPAIAVALGAAIALRRGDDFTRRRMALGLVWIAGYVAYNIYVGGDYFSFGRFFVPVLPVFAWMTPIAVEFLPGRSAASPNSDVRQRFWRRATTFFVIALVWNVAYPINGLKYYSQIELVNAWARIGDVLRKKVPRETTLFLAPAGAMPFFSRLPAWDSLGLTDPVIAHRHVELGEGVAGHEKTGYERVREIDPDLVFFFVEEPGHEVHAMLERYFDLRERYERGELKSDDVIAKPRSFEERRDTILDFLFSTTMLADYELMELRYLHDRALFFVKDTADVDVKDAFTRLNEDDEPDVKAKKGP